MEFIELGNNKYLVKDSNNLIVDEKQIKEIEEPLPEINPDGECEACKVKPRKKGELVDNEKSIDAKNIE